MYLHDEWPCFKLLLIRYNILDGAMETVLAMKGLGAMYVPIPNMINYWNVGNYVICI